MTSVHAALLSFLIFKTGNIVVLRCSYDGPWLGIASLPFTLVSSTPYLHIIDSYILPLMLPALDVDIKISDDNKVVVQEPPRPLRLHKL